MEDAVQYLRGPRQTLCGRGKKGPALAIGDGALGYWKALREVFETTREQRCWVLPLS